MTYVVFPLILNLRYFSFYILLNFNFPPLNTGKYSSSGDMGLLSEGSPLNWEETKKNADHVRLHGILQFIKLYHRQNDCLKWGDEIEYMIVKFDHEKKSAKLSLKAEKLLPVLQEKENENSGDVNALWRPECGAYMIEGTPGKPYEGLSSCFNVVEANMRARRLEVEALLGKDESLLCLTSFPRLGCAEFTDPPTKTDPKGSAMRSIFCPDDAMFRGHPRFITLARNIRERRGKKVVINVPIFKDKNTPEPFVEDFGPLGDSGESKSAALPNHVYMDAMGFGMGCSCLQVTFQACNINEARYLYDQLSPLGPIALALSAASPVHRGLLTDRDCRWDIIAASKDDRTDEELGRQIMFVCPVCRKRFTQKGNLKTHFNAVHLQIKSFECNICHKMFSQKENMKVHRRLHTGENSS